MREFIQLKLILLAVVIMAGSVAWGQTETIIYSTGFENSEGFTATTSYSNTAVKYQGPIEKQWGIVMGSTTTTGSIEGSQSMQMRSYASNTTIGYVFTNFDLNNVSKVSFVANAFDINTNTFKAYYSIDGGSTWVGETTYNITTTKATYTLTVSETGEYPNVRIKIENSTNNVAGRITIDDFKVYAIVTESTLTVSPNSISDFSYFTEEGPSKENSIKVSGLNLIDDIIISAPSNYEISTGFGEAFVPSNLITLTALNGTVSESTIYVRLQAGLSMGNYDGSITVESGTQSKTVSLNGVVKVRSVVISQIYGGGGNSGATFTHDFIELYNPTFDDINITNWSVQYAGATGNFSISNTTSTLLDGIVKAGHYYLIQQAEGTGGTVDLPSPDLIGEIPMGASNFKVALVNNTEPITGITDENVIDFVGAGTANQREGTENAPAGSNTNSIARIDYGRTDTDNNKADFVAGTPFPRNSSYYIAEGTDDFRSNKSGNWNSFDSWQSSYDAGENWYFSANKLIPTSDASSISIEKDHLITIDTDVTASTVSVQPTGKLTIAETKTLTAPVKLLSDASGTATLVGNVNGTAEVNQYIENLGRTYAVSSPVADGTYDGTAFYFNANTASDVASGYLSDHTTFVKGLGYAVKPTSSNLQFTGTLNNGPVDITIYHNRNNADKFRGWNLIGNPYPSELNWKSVWESINATAGIKSSIWFNFNTQAAYNAVGDVSVPASFHGIIPPMQGFWVVASDDAENSTTISLTNAMRLNSTNSNPLRAPRVNQNQIIRLQVSNGTLSDEMLLYFNENASDAYDNFDTQKMPDETSLQIYTLLEGRPMLINGMNAIPYDKEITLVYKAATKGSYTIRSTEFSNFGEGEKVVLKDKQLGVETDLTTSDYNFTSETGINLERFSLILPKTNVISSIDSNPIGDTQLVLVDGKLHIMLQGKVDVARVNVYNSVGQLAVSEQISRSENRLSKQLSPGVYIVTIQVGAFTQSQKLIVR